MATEVEIRRILMAINGDLDRAIAFYETYVPSGQDASLIDRINAVDFYPAFNIISEALHVNAILALCRIWDKRRGTANLGILAKKLRDVTLIDDLILAGHKIDQQALHKWLSDVDAGDRSGELLALRRVRHRALAHRADPSEAYKGKARVAVFGDERKVLEATIPLVTQACSFLSIPIGMPLSDQRMLRQGHSKKFWDQIAPKT